MSPVRYESYGLNVAEAIFYGIPAMVTGSPESPNGIPPTCVNS